MSREKKNSPEEMREAVGQTEMSEQEHEALHAAGIPHSHEHVHGYVEGNDHNHDHGHVHSHAHSHEHTRAVLNRLSRAIGHLQYVRKMVEEGRDCSEVLIQLAAVQSALQGTGKVILQDHLKHCIVDAAQEGDTDAIDELCKAIDRYIK